MGSGISDGDPNSKTLRTVVPKRATIHSKDRNSDNPHLTSDLVRGDRRPPGKTPEVRPAHAHPSTLNDDPKY